jgi:uncharacterized delta-60 repeat protein
MVLSNLLFIAAFLIAHTENWAYRYNGSSNEGDNANSIIAGSDGNVYIAGASTNSGTQSDFMVISVDSDGEERWVYTYNGPRDYYDRAYSIIEGLDGNIYAAGYTGSETGSIPHHDFTVISLTPAGTERWVYRYHGVYDANIAAYSIAVGPDSNLYAAGRSWDEMSEDFTVVSLTPDGSERWVYTLYGPGQDHAEDICVGQDSNIYVAGNTKVNSGEGYNFTIVSLTPDGGERWVYSYNDTADYWDEAKSIAIGHDGNIYAAGYTGYYYDVRYQDFAVISLTPSGDERWVYKYDSSGTICSADDICIGPDGNIYAGGVSCGISGVIPAKFTVISLTPEGNEQWVYKHSGGGWEKVWAITASPDSNIYAAGFITGTAEDFAVVKLTIDGVEEWVYSYDGPGHSYDGAWAIDVGLDSTIYAAGYSHGVGTSSDLIAVSLSSNIIGKEETKTQSLKLDNLMLKTYPNPFTQLTDIRWQPANSKSEIALRIYDATGRVVKTFSDILGNSSNSVQSVSWDGTDNSGYQVPDGLYFVQLNVGDYKETEKIIIVR